MALSAAVITSSSKTGGRKIKGRRAVPPKQIWSLLSGKQTFFQSHKRGWKSRKQDCGERLSLSLIYLLRLPKLSATTKLDSSCYKKAAKTLATHFKVEAIRIWRDAAENAILQGRQLRLLETISSEPGQGKRAHSLRLHCSSYCASLIFL